MDTLLPGITAERMPTSRLTVNVLEVAGRDPENNTPVLFVHGNVSSSLFWQPMSSPRSPTRLGPRARFTTGSG
jgi:pimeloyl-ACP methyl ester carboxylesterase